ncbi:MAG: pyridoxal phosphate-dependent aminotransferase [Burkholderiaceae bacterium]
MSDSIQSARLAAVPSSPSIAAAQRARDLKTAGADLISVTIGEPDFATPPEVIEAAYAAARRGETRYTPVPGTLELRQAAADKFRTENSLNYDPRNEIIVGNGAKQLIYGALTATLDPGDEVIIFAPYWVSYPTIAQLAGAVPVIVPTQPQHGFFPTAEALEAAITERTRWVVLNYPNNPTGAIASHAQLAAFAEVLRRHPRILVLSDEIYEHIRFDGLPFASFGAFEDLRERSLLLNGVSKAYAMTGWRIGYGAGPRALIAAMSKLQSHTTGGACAISQAAAVAALRMGAELPRQRSDVYERRRNLVLERLGASPLIELFRPSGAFYVFARPRGRAAQRADTLDVHLLAHGVAVIGGAGFGMPDWFRMSIATSDDLLATACDRILAGLQACESSTSD